MEPPFGERFVGPASRRAGRPQVVVLFPDLRIGEYPTAGDAVWLRDAHSVSAVVSLQDDADLIGKGLDARELERAYRRAGLRFDRIEIPDGDAVVLAERLDEAVALLEELLGAGQSVYLHCNAGLNRAPTIAIAYLHAVRAMPLAQARDFVKTRRPCVPYGTVLLRRYGSGEG
jgi:protein-tyrosine phosphatase